MKQTTQPDTFRRGAARAIVLFALCAIACLSVISPAVARQSGLTPLSDLGAGTYLGHEGGLYPGGANEPPPAHLAAALAQSGLVRPRAADGTIDPRGVIGFLAVGMSNTNQEFKVFERAADIDSARHARLVFLNGAMGGQAADVIADPAAPYWTILDQRIISAGLDPAQVQVVWLKQAQTNPVLDFPDHAEHLQADLRAVVQILRQRFVNLRLCYLSSRIYGGYSVNPQRSEPLSYESGFAMKWLITDQIAGDPGLNFDPAMGDVKAPLLLWGPYLWADGPDPRSDGLVWLPDDFEPDMVHPAPLGEAKAAALLSSFFTNDPVAAPWYAFKAGASVQWSNASADATVDAAEPNTNFGAAPQLQAGAQPSQRRALLRAAPPVTGASVTHAKLSLRTLSQIVSLELHAVTDTTWNEMAVTWNTAPPIDGGLLHALPFHSPDGTLSAGVTDLVRDSPGGELSFALLAQSPAPSRMHARESGEAPRLVLTVLSPCGRADLNADGAVDLTDLLLLLAAWGATNSPADLNDDGTVDLTDLLILLSQWGPC